MKFYNRHFLNICAGHSPKIKHSSTMRNSLHSILFEGGIGSGKTFLASIMVQHAIRKNINAKYYDWNELLETFIDFNKKDLADDIIEDFKNLDFIALDGVEFLNFNHPQLPFHIDRLAKARLNSGKPIMIFAFNNHTSIQGGSGWQSLLRNCLTIRLPRAIN
jgi:chromosomal replication initiation ATPase DnaA